MTDIRKLFPGQSDEQIINEVKFKGTVQEFFAITTEPAGTSHFTYPKRKETFANE
jgi:hypothetical protein